MKNILFLFILSLVFTGCAEKNEQDDTAIPNDSAWWKQGVVYQIYPRSFKDTDGDGVGDLKGIIEKLDYIKSLGVTMVWINPIYSSPNADNGYDISDYRSIMEEFGTMEDFDVLLDGLHQRDIKFVMDVVVNHSSNQHEWFKESRSSRDNPYRDYYHWWPAEKGKPPYRYSLFDAAGDAWKYDSITNAYYLHYFSKEQPDLKWENPKVRQEVYELMKFWAEKGVDGFRLDAFQFAAKDTTYPEFPDDLEENFIQYYAMQPGLHDFLKEMNQEVFSKYEVMSVAEGAGRNFKEAHELVDADRNELNMAYAFEGVDIAKPEGYSLIHFKEVFSRWDKEFAEKGWLAVFLANHDQARLVSRFGNDDPRYRAAAAKMLNTFILTMRGTPYCYYGDELGMTNIGFDSISQYRDIAALNGYEKTKASGGDLDAYLTNLKFASRDNGRTPMQWNNTPHAGFTTGDPWLPVNNNYKTVNVVVQEHDANSVLNYFKKAVKLRKDNPLLVYGAYTLLLPEHEKIYAYTREWEGKKMLVLLNFSSEMVPLPVPVNEELEEVLLNNYEQVIYEEGVFSLQPYQALVYSLQP
ncbi:MAG: alpha-glucosidase [Flavobacteriaceae bacterium]|nr:alpha-glucosidase [Flavobacteriaceae bacterium]